MIIECPKCKSTFNVADSIEKKNFSNFKCSICQHIWKVKAQNKKPSAYKKNRTKNNYSYVLILNLVILLLAVLALILFKEKLVYSNSFWIEFYDFFLNLVPIK